MLLKKLSIIALVLIAIIDASVLLHWRLQAQPRPTQLLNGSGPHLSR